MSVLELDMSRDSDEYRVVSMMGNVESVILMMTTIRELWGTVLACEWCLALVYQQCLSTLFHQELQQEEFPSLTKIA